MSRVESLPNRTKPRINHRAGVSSRSRARSSSHLGAYKVFVFAQIPSHRILQRLLQRPHGRLFQVCAADDVREQSRDLALRVLHRVVVFVRVHGARAGLTSPRARGDVIATGPASFFSNGQIFRSVAALELFAHTTPRSIARAEVSRARARSSAGRGRRGSATIGRFELDDDARGVERANDERRRGKRARTKGDARRRDAWHNAFDILYKNGRASNAAPRGGTKRRTRSAVVFIFVVGRLLRDASQQTLKKSNQC